MKFHYRAFLSNLVIENLELSNLIDKSDFRGGHVRFWRYALPQSADIKNIPNFIVND